MAKAPSRPRQKLLQAALRCVAKQGVTQTNSYSVAEEAGVSQPSFFYHFQTQQGFYLALIQHILELNHEHVERLSAESREQGAWTQIRAYIKVNLEWAVSNPANADVMFFAFLRCNQDPEIAKAINLAIKNGESRLFQMIAAGLADGEFQTQMPARAIGSALHKMIFGAMIQSHCLKVSSKELKSWIEELTAHFALLLGVQR